MNKPLKVRGTQKPIEKIREAVTRFPMLLRVYNEAPRVFVTKYERSSTKLEDAIKTLGGTPELDVEVEKALAHLEVLGIGVFKNRGRAYIPRIIWYVGNLTEMLSGKDTVWRPVDASATYLTKPVTRAGGLVARSIRSNLEITPEQLEMIAKDIGVQRPGRADLMIWANEVLSEYLFLMR